MKMDFSFVDLVYPADVDNVMLQWNRLTQGTPVTFEMRWKGRTYQESQGRDDDEDAQWVLSACVPILDEDGVLMSIAGNTIDINAQKRVHKQALQRAEALEQARASERKFLQFALLAPIAIYALDSNGEMTYCNNNFFSLTGHDPVEDYRTVDWETTVVHPEDRGIVAASRRALLCDKQPSTVQMRINRSWDPGDGVLRPAWVQNQAAPELDADGNLISVFGTLSDISKFKWAEEIQRTRMEEAIDAKMKQEK
jgi:PAS domain S-box-containing protein